MPKFSDDPAMRFLDYYERYLTAKVQQNREMIWLCAVACRTELRKMGDPTEEAQNCENLFKGFVSQKQGQRIYRDLCDDSRSDPFL
jgi:hypothetical protein